MRYEAGSKSGEVSGVTGVGVGSISRSRRTTRSG